MTLLQHLVPVTRFQQGFTTCTSIQHEKIKQAELEDKVLGVHKNSSKTPHPVVTPPSPKPDPDAFPAPKAAWLAYYPKGSINPSAPIPGGLGFYMTGPKEFAKKLEQGATEVVLSYRMMLQESWEWVKGGKLPGLFGGEGDLSYGCSGGRQEDRCKCFDFRVMWRPKGVGELYAYAPPSKINDDRLLAVPPVSVKNPGYGFSVGRGAFKLDEAKGRWISVAIRVKLNDLHDLKHPDGEVQLWIDGVSVIDVSGLLLRNSAESKIKGYHFQTFFGGNSDEWASPKNQKAWFADVTGVVIQ